MAEKDYTGKIQVRRVTDVHANWSEHGSGEPGKFSFQFILDNGAEEYVVRPTVEDAKVLLKVIQASETVFFDLERKVLIPNSLK
jgi:hypothetical protein